MLGTLFCPVRTRYASGAAGFVGAHRVQQKKEAGADKQIERTIKPYICISFLDEFRQPETEVDVSEVRSRNLT